jgi:ABC-type nitrate/sulfonate/bicarbonate transport system permease component
MKKTLRKLSEQLALLAIVVSLWQILLAHSANPFFVTPSKILRSSSTSLNTEWLRLYFIPTILTFLSGLFFGWMIGISLALIFTLNARVSETCLPIINFVRCIPSVAKVPLFMAIIGIGYTTRITIVTLAVLFPVLIATMNALSNTDKYLMEYSEILGYGKLKKLSKIQLPGGIGEILTSMQASIQGGLIVTIVSEMLGSGRGLGAFMSRSQSTFRITDLWFCLVVIGLLGLVLNQIFLVVEKKTAPWYFKSRAQHE